jgi:hypothetical protein
MRVTFIPLLLCLTAAIATAGEPSPRPPAQAEPPEPPEPPPAPLQIDPEPAVSTPVAPARVLSSRQLPPPPPSERPYRIGGWIGTGLTLAFVTSGIVLGVLAQRDSDALVRLTSERSDGKPLPYDSERQARYEDLAKEGPALNRATIACFIVAGVSAVASGVLFWDASRRIAEQKKALALIPAISTENHEARLLLSGRF